MNIKKINISKLNKSIKKIVLLFKNNKKAKNEKRISQ